MKTIQSGWKNYHAHLDKGFLIPPNRYEDAPAPVRAEWTRDAKVMMTKQDIKRAASQALEKMTVHGTTYVRTHVDVDPLVELRGIEAMLEIKQEWKDRVVLDIVAFNQEGFDRFPETTVLLEEALKLGVNGIGGHTSMDKDAKAHIHNIFALAEKKDLDWIEFHTDETGNPQDFNLPYLADITNRLGYKQKVTAIHCCSLANVEEELAERTIEKVAHAGMTVTTCPTAIATRNLTRVKDLAKAGVPIQLGSDNLRDYFNPLGSGNMLQYGQLLAYVQRFYEKEELEQLLSWLSATPLNQQVAIAIEKLNRNVDYEVDRLSDLLADVPVIASTEKTIYS
ncbi:amidohydrolase family protein [Shouchella lehensis]|uniref:Amidohydrolase n=1 Tax=Shouchella lehensis G1 TaxID=1246626 RepID=A0A060LZN3_9BACI|nr:amidohydrolase family protein [Shouchella lehensis]AIC93284.1 amidohydrolase [Shouchella lehensis G1]